MTFRYPLILLVFLSAISPAFISCEKFEGDQTIPAYLTIDSIYITTDYMTQGTASHRITDAWVYVDDEFIGAFEMPARFPVLKNGKHNVKVFPGVKKNGIAATRVSYEFYSPIQKSIRLTPDSTSNLQTQRTTYMTTTNFLWREDFEDIAITLDTTPRSTAWIQLTEDSDSTFEGMHSAKIVLDSIHDFFEAQTRTEYPIKAAPVYLEMNFNMTQSVIVGIIVYGTSTLYQVPVITINGTKGAWKKIYIDLSNSVSAYYGMQSFRVYFGTFKESGASTGTLLFDNLKIVTRNS
jgi:hypothetical protein